ncbi:MAG: hypothetical protein ACK4RK_18795 [Gemmataceae bacterium]
MAAHLRVYAVPEEEPHYAPTPEPSVRVCLGDLLPLIALAERYNYVWLKDFLDDEVAISSDLFQVLETFRSYHRPSA